MTKPIALLMFLISTSTIAQVLEFDETLIQAPIFESNEEVLYGGGCRTRDHLRWDMCYSINPEKEYTPRNFKFQNYGPNKIVTNTGFSMGRSFEFKFEGMARSDMGLMIWDSPDEYESHAHIKLMTFFPRDIMPAIRYESDSEKDILIVTLPTREEVIFNGKTREVISGVFSEGPIRQTSSGAATSPDVQYTGAGVVIEASAVANWPVGFEGEASAKTVSIKKRGHKTCYVPGKDLWYTDRSKGGNVFFNKKLYSNEAFDSYVKKNCKFSIY